VTLTRFLKPEKVGLEFMALLSIVPRYVLRMQQFLAFKSAQARSISPHENTLSTVWSPLVAVCNHLASSSFDLIERRDTQPNRR